jgi:hypothetical protein
MSLRGIVELYLLQTLTERLIAGRKQIAISNWQLAQLKPEFGSILALPELIANC